MDMSKKHKKLLKEKTCKDPTGNTHNCTLTFDCGCELHIKTVSINDSPRQRMLTKRQTPCHRCCLSNLIITGHRTTYFKGE